MSRYGYNFTHCIYDEWGKIIGWLINGKHKIEEPCLPAPMLRPFVVNYANNTQTVIMIKTTMQRLT